MLRKLDHIYSFTVFINFLLTTQESKQFLKIQISALKYAILFNQLIHAIFSIETHGLSFIITLRKKGFKLIVNFK